jgi:hypothetical protein
MGAQARAGPCASTFGIPEPQQRKPRRVAINVGEKAPVIEGGEAGSE